MLVAAGRFARSANPQGLAIVRALTLAMLFTVIAGVFSNLIAVCNAMDNPEWEKEPLPILIQGFGESINPLVFGGSLWRFRLDPGRVRRPSDAGGSNRRFHKRVVARAPHRA